jgi:cation transport ATPase
MHRQQHEDGFQDKNIKIMTITLIISILLLVAYIVTASIKLGHIPSSSTELATAFDWPWRVWWFIAIWGAAAFAAPSAFEYANDNNRFLIFIAIADAIVYSMCARLNDSVDILITKIAGWLFIIAVSVFLFISLIP